MARRKKSLGEAESEYEIPDYSEDDSIVVNVEDDILRSLSVGADNSAVAPVMTSGYIQTTVPAKNLFDPCDKCGYPGGSAKIHDCAPAEAEKLLKTYQMVETLIHSGAADTQVGRERVGRSIQGALIEMCSRYGFTIAPPDPSDIHGVSANPHPYLIKLPV